VEAARRCSGALGLGYVGVDIVIDAARGAQVLECNAYPGLAIQNVNAAGLAGRIAQVEQQKRGRERAAASGASSSLHRVPPAAPAGPRDPHRQRPRGRGLDLARIGGQIAGNRHAARAVPLGRHPPA